MRRLRLNLALFLLMSCLSAVSAVTQEADAGRAKALDGFLGIPFGTTVRQSRQAVRKLGWTKLLTVHDKENDAQVVLFHSFRAQYAGARTNYLVVLFSKDRFAGGMVMFKNGLDDDFLAGIADSFTGSYELSVADEEFFSEHEADFTPSLNFDAFKNVPVPKTGPEGETEADFEGMELTQEPVVYAFHDDDLATVMMGTLRTNKKSFSALGAVSPRNFH